MLLHVNSFPLLKSSFHLPSHCDSIKMLKLGLFCYTVYSECIVCVCENVL